MDLFIGHWGALHTRQRSSGGKVAYARADVRWRDDLTGLVELTCKRLGRLDAIVANARTGPLSLLEELRIEDWEEMIDVNIKGVLYGIAAALPIFGKQGCGHFVHIASTAALKIVPTMAVYSATKTAVRAIDFPSGPKSLRKRRYIDHRGSRSRYRPWS